MDLVLIEIKCFDTLPCHSKLNLRIVFKTNQNCISSKIGILKMTLWGRTLMYMKNMLHQE